MISTISDHFFWQQGFISLLELMLSKHFRSGSEFLLLVHFFLANVPFINKLYVTYVNYSSHFPSINQIPVFSK